MSALYPLFLRLEGRRVLVVGGGAVAARKVVELLDAGARVDVVAPALAPELEALSSRPGVSVARRGFVDADVEGAWLVVAATDDASVNRAVAAAAEPRCTFVNAVDDPANASAFFASVVRRPPFQIAISSGGELPALSRLVREIVEHVLPSERWVAAARALRARWRQEQRPMGERFGELVRAMAFGGGVTAPAPEVRAGVVVRPAARADLPEAAQMAAKLVRMHHAFDPRRFFLQEPVEKGYEWWLGKCLDDARSLVLVGEVDGRLAGYVYGSLEDRDWNALLDACAAIHDVWVDDDARRTGLGRAMIDEACARFRAMGAPRVVLSTAFTNARAQAFFGALGFRGTMLEMTKEL